MKLLSFLIHYIERLCTLCYIYFFSFSPFSLVIKFYLCQSSLGFFWKKSLGFRIFVGLFIPYETFSFNKFSYPIDFSFTISFEFLTTFSFPRVIFFILFIRISHLNCKNSFIISIPLSSAFQTLLYPTCQISS